MRWLSPWYYQYLFTDLGGWAEWRHGDRLWPWATIWCRIKEHPAGPVWYDCHPDATEPNMDCINCGDRLG